MSTKMEECKKILATYQIGDILIGKRDVNENPNITGHRWATRDGLFEVVDKGGNLVTVRMLAHDIDKYKKLIGGEYSTRPDWFEHCPIHSLPTKLKFKIVIKNK